ncbi:MAG TPA: HdeD family acid-resistance protein [Candidatus Baltobacteraceae bacterium]|nr:HdeD family acid-resistance protein [Candidatus Baltobacteraceae bacterium]
MSSIIVDADAALQEMRKEWGWFLALGLALIALGVLAIVYEEFATLASIAALGIFLVVSGAMQLATAFLARGAGHVILYLLFGLLEILVGFVLFAHPVAGALIVTLTLAVYLVFSGVFRVVYSLWAQMPNYAWAAFAGLIAIALGILLWEQWPSSAVWFLGIAVGVNFIFAGTAWTALALRLRAKPASTHA